MRRGAIAISVVIAGLLLGTVAPDILHGQGTEGLTDFRGRSGYTEEDLAKSLFPQTPSDVRTRGIGPARPQPAPTGELSGNPRVALNVFFEFNSDRVMQAYYSDLDKLGKVLTEPQYSAYRIQVEGHTDSVGSDSYNQHLSERRAESVKRYLVQNFSIPSDRLGIRGFGKSRPIASNATAEGRDQNRRVEVVNLGTR